MKRTLKATIWPFLIAFLVLLAMADGVRQTIHKGLRNPNDFVTLYAGAICMADTCNPYSVPDLDAVLVSRRGTEVRQDWSDQLPIYPPSTLILLLPMSVLSYKGATVLWYVVSLTSYAFGLCWLYLKAPALRSVSLVLRVSMVLCGLHFPKMLQCLSFGNPAIIVTGLLLYAMFAEQPSHQTRRALALLVACLLKPPMAIPLATLVLVRRWPGARRGAALVLGMVVIMLAAALYLRSSLGLVHWLPDLQRNIAVGERGGMNPTLRGAPSNAVLNVANLVGYFTADKRQISTLSAFISGTAALLFIFALYKQLKDHTRLTSRDYSAAVASVAVLSLLPVYHRFCDVGLVLLAVPFALLEFKERPRWQAWFAVPLLMALYISWERRIQPDHWGGQWGRFVHFLYYRGDAATVLLLGAVLISAMWSTRSAVTEVHNGTNRIEHPC